MRYVALDSLRGVCAVMVALYHLPIDAAVLKLGFIRQGYLFVDFFFVLSGFVIAHSYGTKIKSGSDAAVFLVRRWGRVWPLHVALLIAFVLLETVKSIAIQRGIFEGSAFAGGNDFYSVTTNLLLVHSWGMHDGIYWNYPSWSISTEWAAYLCFAAVLLIARQFYVWLAVAIGTACAGLGMSFSPHTIDMTYDYGVLRCLSSFSLGILVYFVHKRLALPVSMATFFEAAMIGVLAVGLKIFGYGASTHLMPLVFAFAVFVFASGSGAVSRLLAMPPLKKLGDHSYSVYMNHVLLIFVLTSATVIATKGGGISGVAMVDTQITFASPVLAHVAVTGYVLALLGLSALTYRWIEVPGQNYFKHIAQRLARPSQPFATH